MLHFDIRLKYGANQRKFQLMITAVAQVGYYITLIKHCVLFYQ